MTALRTALCLGLLASTAAAQTRTPFNQATPPGRYARFMAAANPTLAGTQPVRFALPDAGLVSVYRLDGTVVSDPGDSLFDLTVGPVYRFRVQTTLDGRPVEVYPSVELVDRLHPPADLRREFPVVVEVTPEEIEAALRDRLVTKVVYVRPRNAAPTLPLSTELPTSELAPTANPMLDASLRGRPIAIVRLGGRTPEAGDRGFYTGGAVATLPAAASSNADCRVELPVVDGCERPVTDADIYPDEYICDGGDTGLPNRVNGDGTVDLGFEEAAGTYRTEDVYGDDGLVRLAPTTRVCVYAPAMAAVRTISALIEDTLVVKAVGAHADRRVTGVEGKLGLVTNRKFDAGMQARVRSRGSEVDARQTDANVTQDLLPMVDDKLINAFMEYGFVSDQNFTKETIAVLQDRVRAAGEWSTDQTPTVSALDEAGNVFVATTKGQVYTVYEDRRKEGVLSIIKTADRKAAKLGETVTFQLHFENTGQKPVRDVVISDHLSPRLVLDVDSVDVSLPAETTVEDDFAGGVYLRVTLKDELPGGEGGVITFRTTVR